MRIIAHTNTVFSSEEFQDMVQQNSNINGMSFEVTATKDGKIVLFNPAPNNILSISGLQNSTNQELKDFIVPSLEEVIEHFKDYKKMIILNILPFGTPPLTEDTVREIDRQNRNLILSIKKIIELHPQLNLYLTSTNDNIVKHMHELLPPFKVGLTLQADNLNYMDVDFYKIGTDMVNIPIIEEQLKRKKEILICASACENMALLLSCLKKEMDNLSDETKNYFKEKVVFESNYPELFYCIFAR